MRKFIFLIVFFSISGCAYANGLVEIKAGQGEFRNKHLTERIEAKAQLKLGDYHLSVKAQALSSDAVDDKDYSLINGNNVFIGAGVNKFNTEFTAYASKDYWELEAINKNPINYYNIYTIAGINYLNRYERGRKTTAAVIGVGKKFNNKYCEATYTIRNNTAVSVDDYLLLGCGVNF